MRKETHKRRIGRDESATAKSDAYHKDRDLREIHPVSIFNPTVLKSTSAVAAFIPAGLSLIRLRQSEYSGGNVVEHHLLGDRG